MDERRALIDGVAAAEDVVLRTSLAPEFAARRILRGELITLHRPFSGRWEGRP